MGKQQYDKYWKLTVEYDDIHGEYFDEVLRKIVEFIDKENLTDRKCTPALNRKLQEEVNIINPKKNMASVRKSINQYIKLGFIYPGYRGYNSLTKRYLNTQDRKDKELIFTQIFYENASFTSSYSKNNINVKEVNFLMRTLVYNGKLSKEDLIGLMVTDVSEYAKGYLTKDELKEQYQTALKMNFEAKKYNQIDYLIKFLKYMPNLEYKNEELLFVDSQIGEEYIKERDLVISEIYNRKKRNYEDGEKTLTNEYLKKEAKKRDVLKRENEIKNKNKILVESRRDNQYDIFLSHSSKDKEIVNTLYAMFNECGYTVYVDLLDESGLDKGKVTIRTANILKQQMDNSRGLSCIVSNNLPKSIWCPWEIGYFDGKKNGMCCVFVITDDGKKYKGQEYLGLYLQLNYARYENREKKDFWVCNPNDQSEYIVLREWLKGKKPYKH